MDAATKKLEILKCLLCTHFHLSSKEDLDAQHSFSGGRLCHQLHRLTVWKYVSYWSIVQISLTRHTFFTLAFHADKNNKTINILVYRSVWQPKMRCRFQRRPCSLLQFLLRCLNSNSDDTFRVWSTYHHLFCSYSSLSTCFFNISLYVTACGSYITLYHMSQEDTFFWKKIKVI